MDAQLKAKWVEALRSDEYDQTQGTLCDGTGFCCLGVLCDVTERGKWVPSNNPYRPSVKRYSIGGAESTTYLPPILRAEFRLTDEILDPLMNMNDEGKSFAEIADYIEANL